MDFHFANNEQNAVNQNNNNNNNIKKFVGTIISAYSAILSVNMICLSSWLVGNIGGCNLTLQIWSIMVLIMYCLSFINNVHGYLKRRYTLFILQKKYLKFLKGLSSNCASILLWVVIILGFIVNNDIDTAVSTCNQVENHQIWLFFKIIFVYTVAVFFIVSAIIVILLTIICIMVSSNNTGTRGANTETISQNTVVKTFQEWIGIDTPQCSICMEEYIETEKITKLGCGHFYHESCINQWLKINYRCPFCQQPIDNANDYHKQQSNREQQPQSESIQTVEV